MPEVYQQGRPWGGDSKVKPGRTVQATVKDREGGLVILPVQFQSTAVTNE